MLKSRKDRVQLSAVMALAAACFATGLVAPLGALAARFNALAGALRNERNDVYQKELLLETVLETAPTAILVCDEQDTVTAGRASHTTRICCARSTIRAARCNRRPS